VEKWLDGAISAAQRNISDENLADMTAKINAMVEKHREIAATQAVNALWQLRTDTFAGVAQNFMGYVRPTIHKMADGLAAKAGAHVAAGLDIVQIAESKIGDMHTAEAERLILGVVGKQLRWIALLGGLLGFVIGFLPVLL